MELKETHFEKVAEIVKNHDGRHIRSIPQDDRLWSIYEFDNHFSINSFVKALISANIRGMLKQNNLRCSISV